MRKSIVKALAAYALLGAGAASAADLLEVYRTALDSDPTLAAAAAARQAAQEAEPQARSLLMPNITAGANAGYTDTNVRAGVSDDANYDSLGYNLSLSQAVYHRDYQVQLRQADAVVAQADAEYGATRQELTLRVAQAYLGVLAAEDSLAFAEAEKRAIGQQLRQTRQRFEVGLSAITDVREAQAGYDAAVAQEIAARNQVDVAREALRAITGRGYEELAALTEQMPLVTPEPADIDAWVATALEQNLTLAAAQAAAQVAAEGVDLQQAQRYPAVDLVAQHQYNDNVDSTFGQRADTNAISLQVSVPLWLGGRIDSQVREASALYLQAQQREEAQRRGAVQQTRDSYLRVLSGISQVDARRQAVSSAETAVEATQAGFEVGTRTAVDVLDAQRDLFRARRDYSQSRYDYILATLQLKQAAGVLSEEDIAHINSWLTGG